MLWCLQYRWRCSKPYATFRYFRTHFDAKIQSWIKRKSVPNESDVNERRVYASCTLPVVVHRCLISVEPFVSSSPTYDTSGTPTSLYDYRMLSVLMKTPSSLLCINAADQFSQLCNTLTLPRGTSLQYECAAFFLVPVQYHASRNFI